MEAVKIILDAAVQEAKRIGVDMDIAVTDEDGMLLGFIRMDQAKITSIDIAINKAFTAAGTRKGTHEYAVSGGVGGAAFGIHASNGGRFTIFGGGLPIIIEGQCVGGVGCSSGSAEQDRTVAQAGIDALMASLGD
jgi:uncharacterized protein GlcG (DUF336 family)